MSLLKRITTTALLSISLTSIAIANTEQNDEAGTLPLDELRIFSEVFAKVKNDYVESVDDRQLIENAIRGMLEGLDQHSSYLDKEHYTE